MYIEKSFSYYTPSGQQKSSRARFLILVAGPEGAPLKGMIRKVAMSQLGHWMMGTARAYGESYTLSGAYGADGLPLNDPALYAKIPPTDTLPPSLESAYWKGSGHNSAGAEAPALRAWALSHFPEAKK